jgi:CRISPR-associated protein Csm3
LRLLEDDSLGGGGSRGSGRVRFENWKLTWRGRGFYAAGEPEAALVEGTATTADLQAAVLGGDLLEKLA